MMLHVMFIFHPILLFIKLGSLMDYYLYEAVLMLVYANEHQFFQVVYTIAMMRMMYCSASPHYESGGHLLKNPYYQ